MASVESAQQLYEATVPRHIRYAGDPAVRDFVKNRDFSHKQSFANRPDLAKATNNTVLEKRSLNRARGARNMTKAEVKAAQSAQRLRGITIGAKTVFRNGLRGGYIAAALEGMVSVPENLLHWKRGRKSGAQAATDAAKNTATSAGVGAIAAGALTFVSLGAIATPIAAVGALWWTGGAIHRIHHAAKHDLPLDQFRVFFCKDKDCRIEYAETLVDASRGQGSLELEDR